jgi:DNA-binding NarL/FixJ family response regulator
MLRVAVLDDHPAVLAGLQRLLDSTSDLKPVAAATNAEQLSQHLEGARADVLVVDYDLARGDGLTVCQTFKERIRPPVVVIYSAYEGPSLAISARIAGADALVDKRAPASELLGAIRRAAAGGAQVPDVAPDLQRAAISRLAPDDVPVASMLLAGTSHQGIAETLATDRRDIVRRVRRIVGQLRPIVSPAARADAYCRRCAATFDRPFPRPYGAICPDCLADGDIITLTAPPEPMSDGNSAVGSTAVAGRGRRRGEEVRDG